MLTPVKDVNGGGSVSATFSMGVNSDGTSAGVLYFDGKYPASSLWTRSNLRYSLEDDPPEGVRVVRDGGGLWQVGTSQVVADIVNVTHGYAIKYYTNDGTHVHWNGQSYDIDGNAVELYRHVVYSTVYTSATITGYVAGTATTSHVFSGQAGTSNWTLETGDYGAAHAQQREQITLALVSGQYQQTHTVQIWDGSQYQTAFQEVTKSSTQGGNWTERIVDPGGGAAVLHTYRVYSSGLLNYEQRPGGDWTYYEYDSYGRTSRITTPWENQAFAGPPAQPTGNLRQTEYDYSPVDVYDSGAVDPYQPRRVDEKVSPEGSPTPVARTYYAYYTNGQGARTEVVERCASPTTSYGDAGNLRTTTVYTVDDDTKVALVTHPDGHQDVYEYSTGDFGGPLAPDFGDEGDYQQTLVTHKSSSGELIDGHSTESATISDPTGRIVAYKAWVRAGTWVPTSVTTREYASDDSEVVERQLDPDPADYSVMTTTTTIGGSGCGSCGGGPGSYTTIDAAGTETHYLKDAAGRPDRITVVGAEYSEPYAAQDCRITQYGYGYTSGRSYVRISVGHAVDEESTVTYVLVTQKEYDTAGRLVYEKALDPNTLTTLSQTHYEYALLGNGGMRVTKTRPDGATEITETYADGRTVSVTGTGVIGHYYSYGVNADGTQWTKVATGTSARYVQTTYTVLGSVWKEERPRYGSGDPLVTESTYDAYGRLTKVQRPGLADTLYEYDPDTGELFRTGLDLGANPNGELDPDGVDRITKTVTTYEQVEQDGWWRVTTTSVYATDGDDTATPVQVRRQRLTGFSGHIVSETEVQDVKENATVTTREIDGTNQLVTDTVNRPDTTYDDVTITRNGLVQEKTSPSGLTTWYYHDGIGRQTVVNDPRGNEYETSYNALGQVEWTEDGANNRTSYTYYGNGVTGAGRVQTITRTIDSEERVTRYEYDTLGRTIHTWGEAPQPTEYVYDDVDSDGDDETVTLKTFRGDSTGTWTGSSWPGSPPTAEVTVWTYDPATGLLTQKESQGEIGQDTPIVVAYAYTPEGRLDTRTWDRGVTTTYGYDENTGELLTITYSDSTPGVTYSYTRLGRLYTVEDGAGTRTFAYDDDTLELATETFGTGSGELFDGKIITYGYAGNALGRLTAIQVGVSGTPGANYGAGYTYDAATGRLSRATGPGLPASGTVNGAYYTYGTNVSGREPNEYVADSDMAAKIEFQDDGTPIATTTRWVEELRDYLTAVENVNSGTVSKYAYVTDVLGRRTSVVRTGSAFDPAHHDDWTYNGRNELETSSRYNNTTPGDTSNPVTAQNRVYHYDAIGNRTSYRLGPEQNPTTTYCANGLNQYQTLDDDSSSCPPEGQADETLSYDDDGNLTADGTYRYEWDGENRLSRVWLVDPDPQEDEEGDRRVNFVYDYANRRVQKVVEEYDGEDWGAETDQRFVWGGSGAGGWLMLLELDGLDSNAVVRKYTWGLDLAGLNGRVNSVEAAGGIGGLLAVYDAALSANYVYFYDANGNVGQVRDPVDLESVAQYEYDPYGNRSNSPAQGEFDQPFRFSTKYRDAETELYYFGRRYYQPRLGRWISRDPIAEIGFGLPRQVRHSAGDVRRSERQPALSPPQPRATVDARLHEAGLDVTDVYAYAANRPIDVYDGLGLSWKCDDMERWVGVMCCLECWWWALDNSGAQIAQAAGWAAADGLFGADVASRGSVDHRAIRHCVASGVLALYTDCSCAACLGALREEWQNDCRNQAVREGDRGVFNNWVGLRCVGCRAGDPKTKPTKKTVQEITDCCKKALDEGRMDTGAPDSPSPLD